MPGRTSSLVARGRRVNWKLVLAVGVRIVQEGRKRWENISDRERRELARIVRKSKGRPSNLLAHERQELWRIVRKAVSSR